MLQKAITDNDPGFSKPLYFLDQQKSGTEAALLEEAVEVRPRAEVVDLRVDQPVHQGLQRLVSRLNTVYRDLGFDDYHIITGRNAEGSDFKEIFGKPGAIDSELRELIKKTKASEVIVYYAGRADALDDGEVLLLPSDTVPDKPETGVKLSGLYNNLYAMGTAIERHAAVLQEKTRVAGGGGAVRRLDTGTAVGAAQHGDDAFGLGANVHQNFAGGQACDNALADFASRWHAQAIV